MTYFHDDQGDQAGRNENASLADKLRSAAKSLCVDPTYEIDRDLPVAAADEIERLRALIRQAAQTLYTAEVHRQGVGWDDYCTTLLVRSQHALAAETRAQ